MFLSVLDVFKIGVGPSSSHTMGPMIAARRFAEAHWRAPVGGSSVRVTLWGSLAFTGKGHGTDTAVILGLAGFEPRSFRRDRADDVLQTLRERGVLCRLDGAAPAFDPEQAIHFAYGEQLDAHTNAMTFEVIDADGEPRARENYYSIGGGFVLSEPEMARAAAGVEEKRTAAPHPFKTAQEMLAMAKASGLSISEMKLQNERAAHDPAHLKRELREIIDAMQGSIDRGLRSQGVLPGQLQLPRRAGALAHSVKDAPCALRRGLEQVSAYAIAVNEENAAGGRIVTAPTNGAAGIVPAVMRYLAETLDADDADERLERYLLTAAAIGGLIKANASISGADCGCQAEVGSASAMAAAGLTEALGGAPEQVENAAEIALEHHLGMTCDPVLGLVQVPCIERNAMGAVKAITAASLALRGDGAHFMPLDACIEAMRQTGEDMNEKYKETSLGGLAVNSPNC